MGETTERQRLARNEYMRTYRLSKLDAERARLREYTSRASVKERRKTRDSAPDKVAKRRAYAQTEAARTKAKLRTKERRAENPEGHLARMAKQRESRTGFTPELITQTLIAQDHKCAVCRRGFEGRQIRADHCHDTGKPRGLLCHHCNIMEGMLKSMGLSPAEFAHNLHSYLTRGSLGYTTRVSVFNS